MVSMQHQDNASFIHCTCKLMTPSLKNSMLYVKRVLYCKFLLVPLTFYTMLALVFEQVKINIIMA